MAFDTLANLRVISAISSTWEIWDDKPMPSASGWDGLKLTVAARCVSATAAVAAWPIGTQISGRNFWVDQASPQCLGADIYAVELTCKGLFAERGIRVTGGTASETQQGELVSSDAWSGYKPAAVKESTPSVRIEYVQIGGTIPTQLVGLAGTPEYVPAVRDSIFASISDPLYHWPSGWVFDAIEWDLGPGGAAALIAETWNHVFQKSIK